MKTINIAAIIIISAFALYSFNTNSHPPKKKEGGIVFFNGNWKQALNKAKAEKKIIFLDAYASWCGPCKVMARKTFRNSDVAKFYNKNFINIAMDMEKGEGPTLARRYPLNAYPTLMFINAKGELVAKAVGYYKAEAFLELGKKAKKGN